MGRVCSLFWPLLMSLVLGLVVLTVRLEQSLQAAEDPVRQLRETPQHSGFDPDSYEGDLNYGIIVDAGSSGSRAYVYVWPPHSGDPHQLIRIRPLLDKQTHEPVVKKISPGISSLGPNPNNATNYIRPILDYAASQIPVEKHKETSLFIMATAGLRLIPEEQSSAILKNLKEHLPQLYSFIIIDQHIEMISGKWEGVYSWIAVNYALGNFNHNSFGSEKANGAEQILVREPGSNRSFLRSPTVGMIDMGGGSVQIAYEIQDRVPRQEMHLTQKVNLGCQDHDAEHEYRVYVNSFLGFGANSAIDNYEKLLADELEAKLAAEAERKRRERTTAAPHNGYPEEIQGNANDPNGKDPNLSNSLGGGGVPAHPVPVLQSSALKHGGNENGVPPTPQPYYQTQAAPSADLQQFHGQERRAQHQLPVNDNQVPYPTHPPILNPNHSLINSDSNKRELSGDPGPDDKKMQVKPGPQRGRPGSELNSDLKLPNFSDADGPSQQQEIPIPPHEPVEPQRSKRSLLTSSETTVRDPCLPVNLIKTVHLPTTEPKWENADGYPRHHPPTSFTRKGIGKWEQCVAKLKKLLKKDAPCNEEPCSINGVYQAPIPFSRTKFFGFSEYWYSMQDVYAMGGQYNYDMLNEKANNFCATKWSTLQDRYRRKLYPKADNPRMRTQCIKSAWIATVLHEGFGFEKDVKNFESVNLINGQEVQWTLGAILYKLRYFPLKEVQRLRDLQNGRGDPLNHAERGWWHHYLPSGLLSQIVLLLCMVVVLLAALRYFLILRRPRPLYRNSPGGLPRNRSMWGYMMLNSEDKTYVRIEHNDYVY